MAKRILSAILAVAMVMILLVAVPVSAATHNSTQVKVVPNKTTAKVGDIITYDVVLTPVSEMGSMQMRLVIPEGLSYVANSGKLADGLLEKLGFEVVDWTEQTLIINGFASAADYECDEDTTLATFQCRVENCFVGTTTLDLTYLEFYSCQTFEDHTDRYSVVPGVVKIEGVSVSSPTLTVTADKTSALRGEEVNYTVYLQQFDTITCFGFNIDVADGLTFVDDSVVFGSTAKSLFGETLEYTSPKETVNPAEELPYVSWCSAEGDDVTNRSKIELVKFKCTVNSDVTFDQLYKVGLTNVTVGAGSTQNFADISPLVNVTPFFVYVIKPSLYLYVNTPGYLTNDEPIIINLFKDGENISATVTGDSTHCSREVIPGTYTITVSKADYAPYEGVITVAGSSIELTINLCPKGDVNNDYIITTVDFSMANSHARDVSILSGYSLKCADVVGTDGTVTTADAMRINAHAKNVNHLW